MNQPLVTIIVPVYKVEKYLRRCLDSITAQTYTNFEVILVDDGSPDRCGEICDEYAVKDRRFRVIHQRNGGLSAARNAGLNDYFQRNKKVIFSLLIQMIISHPMHWRYLFVKLRKTVVTL